MNNSFSFETNAQQKIWQLLNDLNSKWTDSHAEELAKFFHQEMVIIAPGFKERIEGREACVTSYKDFCSQAVIHEYKTINPEIDIYDNTAVATFSFEITYEMGGETYHDTGKDLFVFVREKDDWQAVWRTLIPFTQEKVVK